jgi:hypothetical protein
LSTTPTTSSRSGSFAWTLLDADTSAPTGIRSQLSDLQPKGSVREAYRRAEPGAIRFWQARKKTDPAAGDAVARVAPRRIPPMTGGFVRIGEEADGHQAAVG